MANRKPTEYYSFIPAWVMKAEELIYRAIRFACWCMQIIYWCLKIVDLCTQIVYWFLYIVYQWMEIVVFFHNHIWPLFFS